LPKNSNFESGEWTLNNTLFFVASTEIVAHSTFQVEVDVLCFTAARQLPTISSMVSRTDFNAPAENEVFLMSETPSKKEILLARLVIVVVIALLILGALRYGFSAATLHTFWHDLVARPGGPMTFRFILQPTMAAIAAFRAGVEDAKAGRSPYLRTILTNPAERKGRLYEGLIHTAQIILLGLVMDGVYQFIVLKSFYPGQAVAIAILLAFIPYVLLRGPIARIVLWWRNHSKRQGTGS
jgi:hypothetical protein